MKLFVLVALVILGFSNCQFNPNTCLNESSGYWDNQFDNDNCERDFDDYGPDAICKKGVSGSVLDTISVLYPEGKSLTDGLISDKISFVPLEDNTYAYFTFLKTGAGYLNSLGLYRMNGDNLVFEDIFPLVNSFDVKCLKAGDTAVVGPLLANVKYGIYLDADVHNEPKGKIYSDVTMKEGLRASDNVGHVTWVYNEETEDTIFGFEDQINGDYDYNDVMFTLNLDGVANFTDRPIYSNGTIKECLPLDTVTSSSYAENECYSWALLEKTEVSSCSFFLEVPEGWVVAPYDETTKNAISAIDKWDVSCVGVMHEGNIIGVVRSNPDSSCELNMYNDTGTDHFSPDCYGVACSQRIVLRRIEKLSSCGQSYDYCVGTPRTLSTFPSSDLAWNVFPNQINSFLPKTSGSEYDSSIIVRNKKESSKTIVDLVVAFDLEGISSDKDVKSIKDNMHKVFESLESEGLKYRVAFAGYSKNAYITTLFSDTFNDDAKDIVVAKSSNGDRLKVDMIKKAASHNYGWNQDTAVKIVLIVTHRKIPSISTSEVNEILDNNNIIMFAGTKESSSDWSTFANKFKNSVGRKIDSSKNKNQFHNFVKEIGEDVSEVIKYSVLHTVKGSQYVEYDGTKKQLSSDSYSHTVTVKMDSVPDSNSKAVILNALGRSQVAYFIHTNRAPLANDVLVTNFNENGEASFVLEVSDPDSGKFNIRLTNFNNDDFTGTAELYDSSDSLISLNQNFTSTQINVVVDGSGEYVVTYVVDDGCEITTATITLLVGCSEAGSCKVPLCQSQTYSVKKRETLKFFLSGFYEGGSSEHVTKEVVSYTGPNDVNYFFDSSSMSSPLNVGTSGESLEVFYRSNLVFGQGLHLLTYKVYNTEHIGNEQVKFSSCNILISVSAANDPPEYEGEDELVVYEDNKLIFRIDEQKAKYEDESIQLNRRLGVKVDPSAISKGTLRCCVDSVCTACNFDTFNQDGPLPSFEFTPIGNDYGDESSDYGYTTIPFTFFDRSQSHPSNIIHTFSIRVLPVNDAPTIEVDAEIKTLDVSNEANVITKGEEFVFSWNVHDIDNLPSELSTIVTASPFTRSPWNAYSCVNGESDCSNELELDPIETIVRTSVELVNCESASKLKEQLGSGLEDCYARFTVRFVPENAQTPYIKFTIQGTDLQPLNSLSVSKHILLNVLPTNLPPTVWSPPKIESTSLLTNIRIGNATCNTTDDSPPVWVVTLTMTSISENGKFVLPLAAESKCSVSEDFHIVKCDDTVGSINNWIKELRFNISEGSSEANISFVVEDNGFPGLPGSLSSEVVYTHITVDSSIIPPPPKSNSNLLIIALSVGAAGAIAVGVLVALLRNKLSPPADNYFQLGTETVSSSPENPLYRGQTKEGFSGLYGSKA